MSHNEELVINDVLVSHLVATQFPQWKDLPIRPVDRSGWDNRTFHLGNEMLVRMPSDAEYALQHIYFACMTILSGYWRTGLLQYISS